MKIANKDNNFRTFNKKIRQKIKYRKLNKMNLRIFISIKQKFRSLKPPHKFSSTLLHIPTQNRFKLNHKKLIMKTFKERKMLKMYKEFNQLNKNKKYRRINKKKI